MTARELFTAGARTLPGPYIRSPRRSGGLSSLRRRPCGSTPIAPRLCGVSDKGYPYLVNGLKDMVGSGDGNVHPREVEDTLDEHSAVHETVVIGIADARRGEAMQALALTRPALPREEASESAHRLERLAGYEALKSVETAELSTGAADTIFERTPRGSRWSGRERVGG